MASIVMDEERPFRGGLYLYFSKAEAEDLLALLGRASAFPGRVRRMPLTPKADSAWPPEWSRGELEIVAEEGAPHPFALRDLDRRVLRLVVRPEEATRFHDALGKLIEGEWDFSIRMPILDPTVRPTKNAIDVTFL